MTALSTVVAMAFKYWFVSIIAALIIIAVVISTGDKKEEKKEAERKDSFYWLYRDDIEDLEQAWEARDIQKLTLPSAPYVSYKRYGDTKHAGVIIDFLEKERQKTAKRLFSVTSELYREKERVKCYKAEFEFQEVNLKDYEMLKAELEDLKKKIVVDSLSNESPVPFKPHGVYMTSQEIMESGILKELLLAPGAELSQFLATGKSKLGEWKRIPVYCTDWMECDDQWAQ